jgi:uncharacterized repeat protein (TIGR02543 family)
MFVKKTVPKRILAVCLSVFIVLVLLPSSSATEQVSYIGFTSDVHGETANLSNWLGNLDDGLPIERFVFGGDFDYSESDCNVTAANCAALVSGAFPGAEIFTTRGNHDVPDAADFKNVGAVPITGATEDTVGYNTGLVYNGSDYALFIMDSSSQAFLDSDITALAGVLEAVAGEDASKPVLIVSHCPIHYLSNSRFTRNTLPLLEVLNLYPNAVFLWGHNHSQGDPMYGQIKTAGYVIKYASSAAMPINFTYLSMGAMHDNFGGNNDAYGLIVTIQKGTDTATLSFAYKNLGGATVSEGSVTIPACSEVQEPAIIYRLATSITSGKEYAVVFDGVVMNNEPAADTNTMGGETYNYTGLGYSAPTISGNILTFDTQAEAAAATWVFTADGGGWTIRNGDNYLFAQAERTLVLDTEPHVFSYGETGSNGSQLYVTIDGTVFALCFGHGSSLSTQTGDLIYPSRHNTNVLRLYENTGSSNDGSGEEPPAGPGYPLASGIKSGNTYVIVAKSGGNAYALTTEPGSEEDTLNGAPVTVSGGEVLAADITDAMKWLFTTDGNGFDVTNGSDYLNRRSGGGLYISGDEGGAGYSDWIYDASGRLYTYSNSRENYIYLSSGGTPRTFSADTSKDNNVTIYLYELPDAPLDSVAVTGIDAPVSGGTPDTSAAVDAGTVSSIKWDPAVSGMFFAGHTAYTVSVTLQAPGGYDFTAATTATLNGEPVTPVLNGDGTLTVSYTFAKTGAAPVVTYERVTSFTPGAAYVIVSDKAGTTRALQNIVEDEDYLAGAEVTVSGDIITSGVTADMLWTAESGSTGICLVNDNKYLARGSSSNYLVAGDKPSNSYGDWFYNSNKQLYITSSGSGNNYYLYWSSQNYFRANSSAQSDESFYLYKQTITVPELESIEAAFTQDGMIVYTTTNLDDLKANLIVTARYDDGSTILLSDGDYTLSGTLAAGESTVTVAFGEKTAAFTVTVTDQVCTAHTVNFYSGGSLYAGKTVTGGSALGDDWPDDPTKSGYSFGGWFTGENGTGTQYTSSTAVTADVDLFAKWSPAAGGGIPPAGSVGYGAVLGAAVKTFNDVREGDWFYDDVRFVADKGLLGGITDQTFEPGTPVSRATLAAVLYTMDGKPAVSGTNPFKDVPAGAWYTSGVLWAVENGIAAGYEDGTFRPDQSLTREQLIVFIYNYAGYKGCDMALGRDFNLQLFKDASKITDDTLESVKWACGAGLVKGKPGGLLAPKDGASRAEVAAILKRFSDEFED